MSDYVDRVFAGFIAETEDREIDLTGAYGPQSPDLVVAYIQALTGHGWRFEYPYAVDLWEDRRGSMSRDFERVTDWQFIPGDIGVFKQSNGIGTLGILTGVAAPGRFKVFTQNPCPAGMTSLRAEDLLGAWRLTAGAECKALATEYAERHGYSPTCPPGDLTAYAKHWKVEGATPEAKALIEDVLTDEVMRGVEREAADEAALRMLYGDGAGRHFVVSGRGHGKTALLAKLKALFGGNR